MGARRQSAMVATAVAVALALSMPAAQAARTVTLPTAEEAWYLTTPVGGAPGGPSVNPYPSGTLHVGVAGGQEESRSYLTLEFSTLPGDAEIIGGTLVLPVADDAGTNAPDAARIRLCRAEAPEESVEGSTGEPPAADCTISADAVFVAADGTFEVDLSPMLDFLDRGLAVVPVTAADATWHVGFHGRSDDPGTPSIVAELELAEEPTEGFAPSPETFDSTSFSAAVHPEEAPPPPPTGLGLAPTAPATAAPPPPPAPAAPRAAPTRLLPATAASDGAFRYSIIFGLPLALLVGVPYFGFSLSAPVRPRRSGSTPPA